MTYDITTSVRAVEEELNSYSNASLRLTRSDCDSVKKFVIAFRKSCDTMTVPGERLAIIVNEASGEFGEEQWFRVAAASGSGESDDDLWEVDGRLETVDNLEDAVSAAVRKL
ncbi:hypothetical protein [Natrialba swarupiae]|uniref:Uncharacterized protein n=1 Tax=Natrialba swarupiae TaxID=2448032 RepID=A0A5D5AN73_9EURY|nr:hypothetical protein [Natrialba swarupiae]TYT60860.1 hypothetical protein FYC77_16670 [Natrialba swarupiae]